MQTHQLSVWAKVLTLVVVVVALWFTAPASGIVTRTVQSANPTDLSSTTRSFTFLSSGYQDEDAFWDDVHTCVNALHNNSGGVITDPWTRYIGLFNIYGVFESSPGVGVTRPQGPLHECAGMNQCAGPTVDNNLDCKLGTPNPHYISCDISLVTANAAAVPQQDIVVVLVNVNESSAMATNGVAYIPNYDKYMVYFLLHFLNRAVAGLQEEYSLDFPETRDPEKYARANCATSEASAEAKWGYWDNLDASVTDSTANASGCTFSNFVAPTQHHCVMRKSSSNRMCPVCQEALTRALFQKGVNDSVLRDPAAVVLNLLAGMCPPVGRAIYVDPDVDDALVAHAGAFATNSYVDTRWFLNNVEIGTGPALVYTDFSNLTFPSTLRVTVTDRSPYLRPLDDGTEASFQQAATLLVYQKTSDIGCEAPPLTCLTETINGLGASVPGSPSTCTAQVPTALFAELAQQHATLSKTSAVSESNANDTLSTSAPDPQDPPYNKRDVIIAACVSGGIALIVIIVVTLTYVCCVRKNPREVLNVRWLDRLFYLALCLCCLLCLALSVLIIVFVVVYIPKKFVFGKEIFFCGIVIGAVMYLIAVFNYCGVLFRWFIFCVVCCVLFTLGGIGLFAAGTYSIWAYMNRFSDTFANATGRMWEKTATSSSGSAYLCDIQESMQCSGYHASCVLAASSECVPGCTSNAYMTPCKVPFLRFVGGHYYPVGILCVVSGFIMIITAALDMFYFLSFRQLSRTGKLRRSFRNDPKTPVIPITYKEAEAAHKMFDRVSSRDGTLSDTHAVRFLENVFGEALSKEYVDVIRKSGPLTYDEIMSMHFPFVTSSSIDPRMLTPDKVEACKDMTEIEKKQFSKQKRFIHASGTLSPEDLYILFQSYGKKRFLPNEDDIIAAIEHEAAKPSDDAPMLRGLRPGEVEGLRGAWVTLHPTIVGDLTDPEIDLFYQWSHGEVLKDTEAFDTWKKKLDIRNTGHIGWAEFCYPYAQNSLLQKARIYLTDQGKEVPPEMLTKAFVEEKYGHDVVERAFLPYEQELPVERLLALFVGQRDDDTSSGGGSNEHQKNEKS